MYYLKFGGFKMRVLIHCPFLKGSLREVTIAEDLSVMVSLRSQPLYSH